MLFLNQDERSNIPGMFLNCFLFSDECRIFLKGKSTVLLDANPLDPDALISWEELGMVCNAGKG